MPPWWGAWVGVAILMAPCALSWVGARLLLQSAGTPFLPERLYDYSAALGFAWVLAVLVAIITTRLGLGAATAIAMITGPIGMYPLRGPLHQEGWGLARYAAFQARQVTAFSGFWLLLAFAPSAIAAAPPGSRWVIAGVFAALIMFGSYFFSRVLSLLLGARPLRRPDLQDRFDAIVARSEAPRPVVLEVSPRGGTWWNALAIPSASPPRVLFGGSLLDTFTAEESTSIFAHELAHVEQLKQRRWHRVAAHLVAPAGALACAAAARFTPPSAVAGLLWPLVVFYAYLGLRANSQRWELAADRRAAELCGDAGLVARALTRLHALMRLPRRWALELQRHSSHPDLAARLAALEAVPAEAPVPQPVMVAFAEPAGAALVVDAERCHWLTDYDGSAPVDGEDWRAACRAFRSFKREEVLEIIVAPTPASTRLELLTNSGNYAGTVGADGVATLERVLGALNPRIQVRQRNIFRSAITVLRLLTYGTSAVAGFLLFKALLGLELLKSW